MNSNKVVLIVVIVFVALFGNLLMFSLCAGLISEPSDIAVLIGVLTILATGVLDYFIYTKIIQNLLK